MRTALTLVAALAGLMLTAPVDAMAQSHGHGDQQRAFRMKQMGKAMPLPLLEQKVMRQVKGATPQNSLGPEFRGNRYRFKFIGADGKVIWVDVDAVTGEILDRSDD